MFHVEQNCKLGHGAWRSCINRATYQDKPALRIGYMRWRLPYPTGIARYSCGIICPNPNHQMAAPGQGILRPPKQLLEFTHGAGSNNIGADSFRANFLKSLRTNFDVMQFQSSY